MSQSPRYLAIKQYLKEHIQSRQWMPGYRIPTEVALSEQFNVSRMTANKAVKELVAEAYCNARHGAEHLSAIKKQNRH